MVSLALPLIGFGSSMVMTIGSFWELVVMVVTSTCENFWETIIGTLTNLLLNQLYL
jgi:hypothetical protein